MFIVTEVVLNNKKDITNDFLKLFEKDNYIRLEKSFDFNTNFVMDETLKKMKIDYIEDDKIIEKEYFLNNGILEENIAIPSKIKINFYSFFYESMTNEEKSKLNYILKSMRYYENNAIIFTMQENIESFEEYKGFDNIIVIKINNENLAMDYEKTDFSLFVDKIKNSEDIKFYCFNYSPYFTYIFSYDFCSKLPYIVYCINSINISLLVSKEDIFSLTDKSINNVKDSLILQKSSFQCSSELWFPNKVSYSLYSNFFKDYIMQKITKIENFIDSGVVQEQVTGEKNNKPIVIVSTQYPRYGGAATCAYELHKYLLKNDIRSVILFLDNNIINKKIDIDPDNVGHSHHIKLFRSNSRHNFINGIKDFYDSIDGITKLKKIFESSFPSTILAFNYMAPIVMRVLFPQSNIYFLITGSKIISEMKIKIPITSIYQEEENLQEYMEQLAMCSSTQVLPNSGISKNIFEHFYPNFKYKIGKTWDMHEIFENNLIKKYNHSEERCYDIVFISSRFDREVKNINLVHKIFTHWDLKKYKKVCIGIDSQKFIPVKDNILHFGFLPKEEIEKILLKTKIVIIPSFMESYSITNRESINCGSISIVSRNVGNAFNIHNMFICDSIYNADEWASKIIFILNNYNYCKSVSDKTNFETEIKTLSFLDSLHNNKKQKNTKKSILITSVDLPYVGGSGTNSYTMIKELKNTNLFNIYGLYFSSSTQPGQEDPENLGNIYRFNMDTKDDKELFSLKEKIKDLDLILCKNYKMVYVVKKLFPNVKIIYSPSGLRGITASISNNPNFINDINKKDYFKLESGDRVIEDCDSIFTALKKYEKKLENFAFLNCDIIVPNSKLTYKIIKSNKIINPKLTNYIPLTNISLNCNSNNEWNERNYDIGFACYSWKRTCKNFNLVLEIIKRLTNLKIIVIGECPPNSLFEDNVDYYNNVSHETLLEKLQQTKVFVMCSFYDSNPNVVIEALSCECNVVLSENIGGYEYIDEDCIVKEYNNLYEWLDVIKNNLTTKRKYYGPGKEEILLSLMNVFNFTTTKQNFINNKSCVGVYKIPSLIDKNFTLENIPEDYAFSYKEELSDVEKANEVMKQDIYYQFTLKLSENYKFDSVHYIKEIDETLETSIFYNMNNFCPLYTKRVYVWCLKTVYDILNFKKAGLYFLRGTYHNVYEELLKEKNGLSILYPATSMPISLTNKLFDKNIKDSLNVKQINLYDIVLTNVDENNYHIQYPSSTLLPFYKFSSDSFYYKGIKERYIDYIFVATASQHTKNHHLFHAFVKYICRKYKPTEKDKVTIMYIGDIKEVRKNYNLEKFGSYPPCINFIKKDKIDYEELCDYYNNSKVNLLFSGRDAVPRVIFESSACGCYNIALDTLSDGKYFYNNNEIGALIGSPTIKLTKRPSYSLSYEDDDFLWKVMYDLGTKKYDHEKIALTYYECFSIDHSINVLKKYL